jgi:flagellar basal-body rod protein FlgG
MTAQQLQVDVIANNLANVNTTGFKKSKANFQDLLYQTLRYPGAAMSTESEIPTAFHTRDGAFKIDSDGTMVNSDGYPLEPEITIPEDAMGISVGADGTVAVMQAGQTGFTQVGNITLVHFSNPAGLMAIGRNALIETDASGDPVEGTPGLDGLGTLTQGALELSNVNMVQEMVDMIVAQRAYEINSKAIKTSDEMLQTLTNLKR